MGESIHENKLDPREWKIFPSKYQNWKRLLPHGKDEFTIMIAIEGIGNILICLAQYM